MAAGGQIAEFFGTLGFKINTQDIRRFDKTLKLLEKRAKKFSEESLSDVRVNISKFTFSQDFNTRLHKALNARMKAVNSKGVKASFKLDKFDVDQNQLLRDMRQAIRYVENNLRVRIRSDVQRPRVATQGNPHGGAYGAGAGRGGISRFGAGMGAGAAAGAMGRGFIPGLGVAFGVSQLNRMNQQLIGQDLAATAVFGDEETGQNQLSWLRTLGNEIGFDYRSQANPYLKMQASAQTAGMGMETAQHIFQSMAEYGRVMGLSDEDMKGTMRAVEQMLNKGQVYAEELKMQLAEKFPAAIQLMAEAVAEGDTEKLFQMMEDGEIVSLEALPKFADILARQARVGGALTEAMQTSLAEQMRFNNTFNDLVAKFGEAGFEKGQAGIFRTMATFLREMLPLIEGFGEAWKYVESVLRVPLGLLADLSTGLERLSGITQVAKGDLIALASIVGLLLFPLTRKLALIGGLFTLLEDFTGFLAGRDSLLGHFLGEDSEDVRNNLLSFFGSIRDLIETIFNRVEDIVSLLSGTDIPLIDILNGAIKTLEENIKLLTALLGGSSEEEGGEEKGYLSRASTAYGNFLAESPLMVVPRAIGMDDLFKNMGNVSNNLRTDEQERNERLAAFRPDLAGGNSTTQTTSETNYIQPTFHIQSNDPEGVMGLVDEYMQGLFGPIIKKHEGSGN